MAKLNKEQLKKLYDYGGTLSPKDWANLIDSIPDDSETPKYDDSGTVIETTYDEAKALYESSKMTPGVKYAFEYKHNVLAYAEYKENSSSIATTGIKNEFPIQIYIDRNGQLKAIGSYTLEGFSRIKRNFVADFSFEDDIIFVNINNGILYDSMLYDERYSIYIASSSEKAINILTEFLINNGINYSSETFEDEIAGEVIKFIFTISKSFHIYLNLEFPEEYICLPNGIGIHISYGNDYSADISYIEGVISHTGLHNLNFGTFKHSHVIEGYFYDINVEVFTPSIVEANVHNDTFIPFAALVNISSGDIINTTFTYVMQRTIVSDQLSCYIIDNIYTNNNNIELDFNTEYGDDISIPSLIMNTLDENNPYKFAYGDTILVGIPVE